MDHIEEARNVAARVDPSKGWYANRSLLMRMIDLVISPSVPLFQSIRPKDQPELMASLQAAAFAFLAREDDMNGWDWARMSEPIEDMFYKALAQSYVQYVLTRKLQMDRPTTDGM